MVVRFSMAVLVTLGCAACGDGSAGTTSDRSVPDTRTTDTSATDAVTADSADTIDTADSVDTADTADTADSVDTADSADTSAHDATEDAEVDTGGPIAAVPGARCELTKRVGLVEIGDAYTNPPSLQLSAVIHDKPHPYYGAPELTSTHCTFHRASALACDGCSEAEVCDRSGTCVASSKVRDDVVVKVIAGGESQTFDHADGFAGVGGAITLAGATFGLDIALGELRVTLAETTVPAELAAVAGVWKGSDLPAPTSLTITWTPAESALFTHIPMNHHVGGPTFTECAAPGAVGELFVDGPMLAPLSLVTGLEFQGIIATRFAAAETPLGCVEIRYSGPQQFVNFVYE